MKLGPEDQRISLRRQVYLLTCWEEKDEIAGNVTWRFNLETHDGDRRRLFRTLEEVVATIKSELQHRGTKK